MKNKLKNLFLRLSNIKFCTITSLVIFTLIRLKTEYLDYIKETKGNNIVDKIHEKQLKAVQMLTMKFVDKNWDLGELGEMPFRTCAEKRCFAFREQLIRQDPLENSDGIMINVPNLLYLPFRPTYKRNRKQLWLFNTMEPPTRAYCSAYYDIRDLDDWFNITATFRPDSTFVTDYKSFTSWTDIHEYFPYYESFKKKYSMDRNFLDSQLKG